MEAKDRNGRVLNYGDKVALEATVMRVLKGDRGVVALVAIKVDPTNEIGTEYQYVLATALEVRDKN